LLLLTSVVWAVLTFVVVIGVGKADYAVVYGLLLGVPLLKALVQVPHLVGAQRYQEARLRALRTALWVVTFGLVGLGFGALASVPLFVVYAWLGAVSRGSISSKPPTGPETGWSRMSEPGLPPFSNEGRPDDPTSTT
jgi:hypothetical protein